MNSIEVVDKLSPFDRVAIEGGVNRDAIEKGLSPRVPKFMAVVKHDNSGRLEGGLYAWTFWNWLYVENLWVRPELRGHGMGRELLQAAETEATKRGCTSAFGWIENFEAPAFCKKMGYEPFTQMPDFPAGHQRTGFMKRLAA